MYLSTDCARHAQVDCEPRDNIVIRILEFRPSAGGYLKLVLLNVAGSGAISSLGIRMYQTSASSPSNSCLACRLCPLLTLYMAWLEC